MKRLIFAAAALAVVICVGVYLNMGFDAGEAAFRMMPEETTGGVYLNRRA